jgi:plastocyanin
VADSATETLTLIAGPNITLTTNPAGDAVTISASASGTGGASGVSSGQANRLAYYASTGAVVQDSGPNLEWNGTFLQLIGTIYVTGQKNYVRQYWDSLSDLNIEAPPTVWRGMVAYSGDTGRVYYAHSGTWNRLARFDEIPATVNAFGRIQAGGQTIASSIPNDILSVVGGVGIEVSSDPTTKTLLITNTGGGTGGDSGFSAEDAQDSAASLFLTGQHTGITFTYDDFNNRINAAVTAIAGIYTDEQAQDAAGALFQSGVHNGITFTYDDANNRIDASIANDTAREYIQDQSAALFTAGVHSNISFTYDDANNRINASVPSPNIFSTIAVSGQLNVVADSTSDTLTLVAGAGIVITTNSTTDAITITSTVSGGGVTAFTELSDRADLTVDRFYLPAITMLSTTNNGASSYRFDQYGVVDNPTVYAINGTTIAFNLNVAGHPFLIQTAAGVNYNDGLTHVTALGLVTTGAAAQGKTDGTLYWKIPISISGNYRYICSIHGGMVGVISIKNFSAI